MTKNEKMIAGKYRIVRSLGEGAEGAVYLAMNCQTGSFYAVKEMGLRKDTEELLKLYTSLNHPGLPAVWGWMEEQDILYCIMEYIAGENLQSWLLKVHSVREAQILEWAIQLCEILEYLHGQSPPIYFQDVKPSNIMIGYDGQLRLIDFGMLYTAADGQKGGPRAGTPGFLAPELLEEKDTLPGPATDIYALGMTLRCLCKKKKGISRRLLKCFEKCICEEPDQRYHSVRRFVWSLRFIQMQQHTALFLILLFALGALVTQKEQTRQEIIQQKEITYSESIRSSNLREVKSAIILFPDREEGYQTLLNIIREDGKLDKGECDILKEVIDTKETGYEQLCYDAAVLAWFYGENEYVKQRAAAWFDESGFESGIWMAQILEFISDLETGKTEHAISTEDIWDTMGKLAWDEQLALQTSEKLMLWNQLAAWQYRFVLEFKETGISDLEWKENIARFRQNIKKLQEKRGQLTGLADYVSDLKMLLDEMEEE